MKYRELTLLVKQSAGIAFLKVNYLFVCLFEYKYNNASVLSTIFVFDTVAD